MSSYSSSSDFQDRYVEAIDSLHHLCSNIEPGTPTDTYIVTKLQDILITKSIVLQVKRISVRMQAFASK